jgi:hypothetical protein
MEREFHNCNRNYETRDPIGEAGVLEHSGGIESILIM